MPSWYQASPLSSSICCPRDCVSRHNGGTSGAPLKPLRDDSALMCQTISHSSGALLFPHSSGARSHRHADVASAGFRHDSGLHHQQGLCCLSGAAAKVRFLYANHFYNFIFFNNLYRFIKGFSSFDKMLLILNCRHISSFQDSSVQSEIFKKVH